MVEYMETGRANDSFHDFDHVTGQIVMCHEVVKQLLLKLLSEVKIIVFNYILV